MRTQSGHKASEVGDLFIAAGLKPACLEVLSPSAEEVEICSEDPGREEAESPDAPCQPSADGWEDGLAAPLLELCSEVCSRWFLAMRRCITRDRIRQQQFREDNGLPKSARIPYEQQPFTESEKSESQYSESIIRTLFGDDVADYARKGFDHAVFTGDMRSFKIRLVMLKIRNSLKGSPLYRAFSSGLPAYIERTESRAGCKPDNSPRRMSRAEKEKARLNNEKRKRDAWINQELPLLWTDNLPAKENTSPKQDIEHASTSHNGTQNTSEADRPQIQDIENRGVRVENLTSSKKKDVSQSAETRQDIEHQTVTPKSSVTVTPDGSICRKAREYKTVDQIVEDIYNGKIVPYESFSEIDKDLRAGLITPVEAFMFTAAMERCEEMPDISDDIEADCETLELDGRDDEEDDEFEEEVDRERPPRSNYSLNPMGFGGCAGGYTDSDAEWNTDDNW